jgi:hypothetical protein
MLLTLLRHANGHWECLLIVVQRKSSDHRQIDVNDPNSDSDGCGKSPGHVDCSPPELHAEGTQSPKGHAEPATRVYRRNSSDERSKRESASASRNRSGQLTIRAALSGHDWPDVRHASCYRAYRLDRAVMPSCVDHSSAQPESGSTKKVMNRRSEPQSPRYFVG